MYYITSKRKGNKFGVADTKDGVIEYYTKDEIWAIQHCHPNIKILDESKIEAVVEFLHEYYVNEEEFGGSEYEYILSCLDEHKKPADIGGSLWDYVRDMRDNYNKVSKYGFDIRLSDIAVTKDLFVRSILSVFRKQSGAESPSKWGLDNNFVNKMLW